MEVIKLTRTKVHIWWPCQKMYISANKTVSVLAFREGLLKGSHGKYSGSSFSLKPTRNNGGRYKIRVRAAALVVKYLWGLVFYFFLFFFSDRAQAETLQRRRGYLSVPVRHSIRTDGSSVIKMALCYNGEDEDARERVLASVFAVGARQFVGWWTRSSPDGLHTFDRNDSLITTALISSSDNDVANKAIAE